MSDLSVYRKDFPLLEKWIYLDNAATTQKPSVVIDTMSEFYKNSYATVHRGVYQLAREATERYEGVRTKVQKFLNAQEPAEIIFTRGTTASLNLVAASFGRAFLQCGDRILISEIEHHSNVVPWQMIAKERGLVLEAVKVNERGELLLDHYQELLDEGNVKIVSLAHISNALGTLHPIKEIVKRARRAGAKICLDGAQSAAHMRVDVRDLDVDFYLFSGHKLYGPTGVGVLYGKRALLDQMPPIEGGGDMIEKVTLESSSYAPLPFKFEAGTPMIAEVIGLGSAIDYLEKIGLEAIERWEKGLLEYATKALDAIEGVRIIGRSPHKGAILSFTVEGVHPLDLGTLLDTKAIAIRTGHHCSQMTMARFGLESTARVSFGLYNTFDEVDRFVLALNELSQFLRFH